MNGNDNTDPSVKAGWTMEMHERGGGIEMACNHVASGREAAGIRLHMRNDTRTYSRHSF
jgi:hypothetical protein